MRSLRGNIKIYLFLSLFPFLLNFSFRRQKDINFSQINSFLIQTQGGVLISYIFDYFPDNEIYLRLENPEAIKSKEITLDFLPQTREDFLKAIFLVSTINEYQPLKIKVNLEGWEPQNDYEEAMLYALGLFAGIDNVNSGHIYLPISFDKPQVSKFDHILYLDSRFKSCAQELGEEFDSNVIEVEFEEKNLHWNLQGVRDLQGEDILIVHSTENYHNILNLISLLYSLRKQDVRSITLVNTYQGYARQDKIFRAGEGASGYSLLKVLNSLVDYNFAIATHFGRESGYVHLRDESVYNINGFPLLARAVLSRILEDYSPKILQGRTLVLLSPDDGSFLYVKEAVVSLSEYLKKMGINLKLVAGYLEKRRETPDRVVITGGIKNEHGEIEVSKDSFFIILDDETSTGMTIKIAVYHLVENLGFDWWQIYSGVVHGKFVKGVKDFFTQGENYMPPRFIACLNTLPVPKKFLAIDVTDLIKDYLKKFLSSKNPLLVP